MDDKIKSLTISTLRKIIGDFDVNSLEIKFYQTFKDRYDIFGTFKNKNGIYEFAISVDKKGNIKRDYVNLIMPIKINDDIDKKIHSE